MCADTTFSVNRLAGLSTDPAHLFMQLYDLLPDNAFTGPSVAGWLADPEVGRRAGRVETSVFTQGSADPERLGRVVRWSGERGLFTLLLGLDHALWYVNPFGPAIDRGGLTWLSVRYAATGLLNDPKVVPGALLPRCAYPAKPRGRVGKADFFSVHRVPPEYLGGKVQYEPMPARHQPAVRPEEPVRVGCAPFLADFTELELSVSPADPSAGRRTATYRLGPAAPVDADTRITTVIDKMDAAGAVIGVLPEGCLSDELFQHWRRVAMRSAGKDKPLRWLLLGSGPLDGGDPPANRAVLLDRWTGETLLTHDKLERFTLDARQVRTWRLPRAARAVEAADPGTVIEEDIAVGSTIAVRDSSLGRLAVLICEDLSTSMGWDRELASLGVSHLLVPIFSKPIYRYRWEQQDAERQATELGAWVVISNSLAVATAMGPSAGTDWYTCLVAGPGDPRRATWTLDVQLGRAGSGDDLGWIVDEDGQRRLPTVLAGAVRASWLWAA